MHNFVFDRTNFEEKHFEQRNLYNANDSAANGNYINESFINGSLVQLSPENNTLADDPVFDMLSRETCIYIYTAVTVGTVVATLARSFAFFSVCMRASIHLHDSMFRSITRATMYFFNTNPSGK
jgi:ATP-binding cassette subfamily C (CFTR/MRP) protein 4